MTALGTPAADFGAHTLICVSDNSTSTALLAVLALATVRTDVAGATVLASRALAVV